MLNTEYRTQVHGGGGSRQQPGDVGRHAGRSEPAGHARAVALGLLLARLDAARLRPQGESCLGVLENRHVESRPKAAARWFDVSARWASPFSRSLWGFDALLLSTGRESMEAETRTGSPSDNSSRCVGAVCGG